MFDTTEEAAQKLHNTVVMYDEVPCHVLAVDSFRGHPGLCIQFLGKFEGTIKDFYNVSDELFNFKELGSRLGYANVDYKGYKQAVYSRRMAVRKSHSTQGLSDANVKVSPLKGNNKLGLRGTGLSFTGLRSCPGLVNTMQRSFPNLATCAKRLDKDDEVTSLAFDPYLRLRKATHHGLFYLDYKDVEIGYTEDFQKFKIQPEYRYLDELLIEDHKLKVA